jgi:hypothetical protein
MVQPASQVKGELARMPRAQCASAVLMIRPAAFGSNPETAASNAFQSAGAETARDAEFAMAEFDAVAEALERAGVQVIVVDDSLEPAKPDAVFPNNWLSLHHDGTAVLYPMLSPLRRRERRRDVIGVLESRGFAVNRILDLTGWESSDVFLEGTGSIVLDHHARVAFACESPRTNPRPLEQFAAELGYEPRMFRATGPAGEPVYHTNVLMCIGERFALACLDAVGDATQQRLLREGLEAGGRELVEIDRAQMGSFAGNALALEATDGTPLLAMSAAGWGSLSASQQRALERHGRPVTPPVPTIERVGGGSVRCMLAEVFLPRAKSAPADSR